jgi:cell cycle sensor histidine kinase DivJ
VALVWAWALCAVIAVGITGGVAGPVALWLLTPVIASVALNQRRLISLGVALSFVVCLLGAFISLWMNVRMPDVDESRWLSLIAGFSIIIGLGVALLPALRARSARTAGAEEARDRLLKILTEQPQMIVSLDETGKVISAYGEAPAGLDLKQLMTHGLIGAVHQPDRVTVEAALEAATAQGRANAGFTPHGGMDQFVMLSLRRGADGRLYGALADAALQHAREMALEAARAEAEQSNQGKTQFLANMSHELRTPLNAVIGFSDIMRQQLFGELPPKYAEYAQLIWESGQHVLDMINDVLDMSKIEAQKYELDLESFDIREPVSAALRLMRAGAHEKGIEITSQMPAQPVTVTADKRAIKQICLNLLSNAVKFTPKGGDVMLTLEQGADEVEIAISDTGIGIAPDDLSRIGQPYEQAGAAEQRSMGTGLGLSLVKAMAHLHGGRMTLSSRLGEGTTVRVVLPLASDAVRPAEGGQSIEAAAKAAINPLEDYTYTPETMATFGDFVIRPPKS